MKIKDIRSKSTEELQKELKELKSELFKLRFQFTTNQLDNPMLIKGVKRDIAKVLTVLKERENAAD
ncbi:MAG: 50S ribosomal protein L29 [Clostridia bacterium]|nr:50S ribosomal protein L29 [Clostridia bacterium]